MKRFVLSTAGQLFMSLIVLSLSALATENPANDLKSTIAFDAFDLIHTKPDCAHKGKTSTWCTVDDKAQAQAASGMVERINSILDTYALNKVTAGGRPRVYLAYLSFSNSGVQKKLCDLGKAGVSIEIVLDAAYMGQLAAILQPECQQDPTRPNISASPLGGLSSSPWRLHHNKFLIIDPGDGTPLSINFSSGNLSSYGTSLHLDHWVLTTTPADSNFAKAHLCLIEGLRAAVKIAKEEGMYSPNGEVDASKDSLVADTYISAKDSCYAAKNVLSMTDSRTALQREGIAPVFAPNANNEVYKVFRSEIDFVTKQALAGKPAYLYIAIQHFLHGGVASALINAADAGVDVRLVMDDDILTGESEVPGVHEFYMGQLKNSKIKVRFVQTNASAYQMMHNKLAILNGKRTFSGAGHYTTAAFRNNWENFYLVENAILSKKYGIYFKSLWDKSIDEQAITDGLESGQPPIDLHPEFIKMISTTHDGSEAN